MFLLATGRRKLLTQHRDGTPGRGSGRARCMKTRTHLHLLRFTLLAWIWAELADRRFGVLQVDELREVDAPLLRASAQEVVLYLLT